MAWNGRQPDPRETGLVVDLDAAGELTRAMNELADDGEWRGRLGRRALEVARERSWEPLLEELFGEAALGDAAGPRPERRVAAG